MRGQTLEIENIRNIRRLHQQNFTISQISEILHIDRHTIARYINDDMMQEDPQLQQPPQQNSFDNNYIFLIINILIYFLIIKKSNLEKKTLEKATQPKEEKHVTTEKYQSISDKMDLVLNLMTNIMPKLVNNNESNKLKVRTPEATEPEMTEDL